LIVNPPARDKETRELIERFKAKRKRRRTMRVAYASLGGLVLLALVITVALLMTRGQAGETGADATSDATSSPTTVAAAPASGATTMSSTTLPPTTLPPTTLPPTTLPPTTLPPTTLPPTTSTTHATTATTRPPSGLASSGLVVCIDPGHQAHGDSSLEPVGPGSSDMKAKVSDGTAGTVTGTPESQLVLAVSLKLRDALVSNGIKVVMTRTTQDVRLSNIERAEIANQAHAALFVRIHADGSEDGSVAGIHVLYPVSIKGWTDDIATASKQAATLAQRELIAATGAKDRGIDARSDMTGFNWSDVPVILPEIGFMSNAAEDRLLATPAYQDKIVAGLTRAILDFLRAGD
jgi:N-acetylmuramoyl-L-alanine amidase